MQKRFNIRGKKLDSYLEWVIFLLKRYSMSSLDLIVNKKQNFYYRNNQYSVPEFGDLLSKLDKIINYEKDLVAQRKLYDEYIFD